MAIEIESEMVDDSPIKASPPTIANAELVGPTVHQSAATSSVSPTISNTEHLEVDQNDSEMDIEPSDAPEPWDDSLYPHDA